MVHLKLIVSISCHSTSSLSRIPCPCPCPCHDEYASSAWDSHTNSNKYKQEAVQHSTARFVTRHYNLKTPGTSIVQELGWRILEQRRRERSLKLMFKVVNGQSGLKMSDYCKQTTKRLTRQSRHEKCYVPPHCRTDTYQQSYFTRTIREWNVLPLELVGSCSLDSFSAGLARYLYDWALDLSEQCSFAELTTGTGTELELWCSAGLCSRSRTFQSLHYSQFSYQLFHCLTPTIHDYMSTTHTVYIFSSPQTSHQSSLIYTFPFNLNVINHLLRK